MQKLERRNTYTPLDASQVQCNCDYALNKDFHPSVHSLKTLSNNPDVNQYQHTDRPKVIVYVLHQDGTPLMPCKPAKAMHLLKQKKAKVVSRKPFTIQLLWNSEKHVQPIKLGVDAGYKKVGLSAVSNKKELLSAEVTLRTDIPKKLLEKAMYRRVKRNKLWYRPARFDNRGKEGWLAPSIQHKLDSHIRLVEKIKKLLPITKVVVEVANFDIQKIKNPSISDKEYQQGEQLGFWNTREYVLHRDNHACQHPNCKHKKEQVLVVHHINGKMESGATNRPEELITLHQSCHKEHHSGKNPLPKIKIKQFKDATFMSIIRWKLVNALKCQHTYGYITKHNRIKAGLSKSHINDAFIIAGGTNQERCKEHVVKQVRRNNRCLQLNRKGFRPSIRRQHYFIQPGDIIRYQGKEYISKGVHCKGSRVRFEDFSKNIKDVELVVFGKGLQFLPKVVNNY